MKRHALAVAIASVVMLFAFAVPASAAVAPITQSPYTGGQTYQAGSELMLTWESLDLPSDARLTLYLASEPPAGGLLSQIVATDLPQSWYDYPVTIPSSGGPYFYYLNSQVDLGGGTGQLYESNAFWDYDFDPGYGWWFTVGTVPQVTLQPYGTSVPEGYAATFHTAASGVPAATCQWQVDDGSGSGFGDIYEATGTSYTTPQTTIDMDGWRYRAVFTNSIGSVTTNEVELTVEGPSIGQWPAMGGKTYTEGTRVEITWESDGLDPDLRLTLVQEFDEPDGNSDGWAIATDLPLSGSYAVTIPTAIEGTRYSYYLYTSWPISESVSREVFSNGFGQWFDVTPPQTITISAPWVTPSAPRARRLVGFEATVTPTAAASGISYTLHLEHLEATKVNGHREMTWVTYPDVILTRAGILPGGIGGGGTLPTRGDWKMWVTSAAGNGYAAGTSPETYFSVK